MGESRPFEELISKWDNVKALVAGDVMLDVYLKGIAERISPEAPVPVVKVESESYILGGAANVANNIKSLKGQVYLCGVIGDDKNGTILTSSVTEKGIDSLLITNKDLPTITKTRITAQHQQLLRYDIEEAVKKQPKNIEREIEEQIKSVIKKVNVVVLSDYNKGFFSYSLSKKIITLANEYKIPVIVDPKPQNALKFKHSTALCPNHHEAEKITKVKYCKGNVENLCKSLLKMGEVLTKKLGVEWAIITCGEDGMFLTNKNLQQYAHYKASAKEVYDVTGCGDTVTAVLALNFGAGNDPLLSTYMANCAGGVAVGKAGTATITREELVKAIKEKNGQN